MLFAFAPLVAYVLLDIIKIDFSKTMTMLSFVGLILIILFRTNDNPIIFPKYAKFYLLFVLYTYFSQFVLLDREFKINYLYSNVTVGAFNTMIIIENISIGKKYMSKLLKISKIILFVAFIVILLQQVFDANLFVSPDYIQNWGGGELTESRLPSIYSYMGTLVSTGFGFVPIFLIIVELLGKNEKKNKMLAWILAGVIFSMLTKGRWIMLNALLVFVLLYFNNRKNLTTFYKYIFLIPIFLTSMLIILDSYGLNTVGIVEDRILESNDGDFKNKSASTRVLAVIVFSKLYWDHPILGIGNIKYGMAGTGEQDYKLAKLLGGHSSQIHVGYLSLFYMYGLVGGILFLSFLYLVLKKLYTNAKNTGYYAPFLGVIGFAIANLTLVTFSFFEMGLVLALLFNRFYSELYYQKQFKNI